MFRIHRIGFAWVVLGWLWVLVPWPESAMAAMIDAGDAHTCAIGTGGIVKCWGANNHGQLGNGTTSPSLVPTDVMGITGATAVAAGYSHSCAIVGGGAVECWGYNDNGGLGDGTTTNRLTPVRVVGLSNATAVAAGFRHSCAIVGDGAVYCWGNIGSLGNGTSEQSAIPVAVSGIDNASAIVAGYYYTCAIVDAGAVKCWGLGVYDVDQTLLPQRVPGVSGVTSLSSSKYEVCALFDQGTVTCWHLAGDDAPFDPAPVQDITGVVAHTPGCAVLANGAAKCWYDYGGFEDQDSGNFDVPGANGAIELTANLDHICARFPDQSIDCWGHATFIGNGVNSYRDLPVVVAGVEDAVDVVAAGQWWSPAAPSDSCALLADGTVTCWGVDYRGNSAMPQLRHLSALQDVTALAGGAAGLCALAGNGMVACRRLLDIDAPFESVPELDNASLLAVGGSHVCAIVDGGSIRCWGNDGYGQLGDGDNGDEPVDIPVTVVGVHDAIDVALGPWHSCAITAEGKVMCWGTKDRGGSGLYYDEVPREITRIPGATSIATSAYWICVVAGDGTVHCDNSQPRFAPVDGITGVVDVAVGSSHSCALIDDGTIACWEMLHTEGDTAPPPARMMGITTATAISAQEFATCAVGSGGVRCWGVKDHGNLGDGSSASFGVPQPVVGAPFSRTTDVQVFAESGALSDASISPFSVQVGRTAAGSTGRVHLTANPSPTLVDPVWNCVATGDAECPFPNGLAGELDVEFALPPAGDLQFRLLATIDASRGATAKLSVRLTDASDADTFAAIERQRELPIVGGNAGAHRGPPRPCSGSGSADASCESARTNRAVLQHRDH